jgi:hypothetical protein
VFYLSIWQNDNTIKQKKAIYNIIKEIVERFSIMKSIKLRTHIGEDGLLKVELPTELTDIDIELIMVYQPVVVQGWPEGFLERTYGSFADDPLERPPQGEYEERDELL